MEDKTDLYIGKEVDSQTGELKDKVFYKTKDLSTHAVIIGMTGSGKTGMAIVTLEEAILDGLPVIAIDPKGDLTNMLLTFPNLTPEEFKPWVDPNQAEQKGISVDMYSEQVANTWRKGLSEWEVPLERIAQLKNSADFVIFTPGSNAGIPVSALQNFKRPSGFLEDEEVNEKIKGVTSALLGLIGIVADPVKSREHILVSTILQNAWANDKDLSIEDLIMQVQNPPFEKLGVFSVDSFFPKNERINFAMQINALIASPTFATWLQGEPLNIDNFIRKDGKSRVSIFYIAHLSDSERMFFVTLLLQELLSWMRTQPGTDSPRMIFYFDEVFGYFPPYPGNPPSKYPLLSLMKQARAFGVSMMLATQNPVDIDYKGLSNAGTWLLGKLQQERDKERVMSGLEGTIQESGKSFDRGYFNNVLGSLKPRVFLLHNIHTNIPKVITSRWAMSYLRGPLTKSQISTLMGEYKKGVKMEEVTVRSEKITNLPAFPEGIPIVFESNRGSGPFIPYIYVEAEALYKQESANIFVEKTIRATIKPNLPISESDLDFLDNPPLVDQKPVDGATFAEIPDVLMKKDFYKNIQDQIKQIIKSREEKFYYSPFLKLYSNLGEPKEEFVNRIKDRANSMLQEETNKIRDKYAKQKITLEGKIKAAEDRKARAEEELKALTTETAMDVGSGILAILTGRSARGSIRRAGSNAITRRQKATLRKQQAEADVQNANQELMNLQSKMDGEMKQKEAEIVTQVTYVEEKLLRPAASSIVIKYFAVLFR